MHHMRYDVLGVGLVIAAALGACGKSNSPPAKLDSGAQAVDLALGRKFRETGAEALEALTEHAATTPMPSLENEAASASEAVSACQHNLPDAQATELERIVQRIGEFRLGHDRTALALSAVEGFRIIVSTQVRSSTGIPLAVALLDYAGFRYQASVRAPTPLWNEARLAIDFADAQWRTVSDRVSDASLKSSFDADLAAMRRALEASDAAAAQGAATLELNRVDALEQYFAPPPAK